MSPKTSFLLFSAFSDIDFVPRLDTHGFQRVASNSCTPCFLICLELEKKRIFAPSISARYFEIHRERIGVVHTHSLENTTSGSGILRVILEFSWSMCSIPAAGHLPSNFMGPQMEIRRIQF